MLKSRSGQRSALCLGGHAGWYLQAADELAILFDQYQDEDLNVATETVSEVSSARLASGSTLRETTCLHDYFDWIYRICRSLWLLVLMFLCTQQETYRLCYNQTDKQLKTVSALFIHTEMLLQLKTWKYYWFSCSETTNGNLQRV